MKTKQGAILIGLCVVLFGTTVLSIGLTNYYQSRAGKAEAELKEAEVALYQATTLLNLESDDTHKRISQELKRQQARVKEIWRREDAEEKRKMDEWKQQGGQWTPALQRNWDAMKVAKERLRSLP